MPELPMPAEASDWRIAANAAQQFWQVAAADLRISDGFRHICAANAALVADALTKIR